jgi:hypothetical protein
MDVLLSVSARWLLLCGMGNARKMGMKKPPCLGTGGFQRRVRSCLAHDNDEPATGTDGAVQAEIRQEKTC